jgi:hypothetical protein
VSEYCTTHDLCIWRRRSTSYLNTTKLNDNRLNRIDRNPQKNTRKTRKKKTRVIHSPVCAWPCVLELLFFFFLFFFSQSNFQCVRVVFIKCYILIVHSFRLIFCVCSFLASQYFETTARHSTIIHARTKEGGCQRGNRARTYCKAEKNCQI